MCCIHLFIVSGQMCGMVNLQKSEDSFWEWVCSLPPQGVPGSELILNFSQLLLSWSSEEVTLLVSSELTLSASFGCDTLWGNHITPLHTGDNQGLLLPDYNSPCKYIFFVWSLPLSPLEIIDPGCPLWSLLCGLPRPSFLLPYMWFTRKAFLASVSPLSQQKWYKVAWNTAWKKQTLSKVTTFSRPFSKSTGKIHKFFLTLENKCQGPAPMGPACSRVGACGLEMPGRQTRDAKEKVRDTE